MASTLIAGRVDSDVAKRTQFYINKSGTTQADVIRHVWQQISDTGIVPIDGTESKSTQKELIEEMRALRQITPRSDFLENLSPQDLKRELRKRG